MKRYKLSVSTPDADVIECGETVAATQDDARNVAWERYRTLCDAGHAPAYKRDRCNVEARAMIAVDSSSFVVPINRRGIA